MAAFLRQLTHQPHGHILANRNCWSADGCSLLFDTREDETKFTGNRIQRLIVETSEVQTLYQFAYCGVPTCSAVDERYVFIHGPDPETEDWRYSAWHRHGAIGHLSHPNRVITLDARDYVPPYSTGALRGGTHLHTFSPNGERIASTYEDHVLATTTKPTQHSNRRLIAVSQLGKPVVVPKTHPRNQDGNAFTVVVTEVAEQPQRDSDEIYRAYGEAWIDNSRIVFQADVLGENGHPHTELFVVTIPDNLTMPADHPLQGTPTTRPGVPQGVILRRLTRTDRDTHPGIAGPRHWAVASPDGAWIGCFRHDAAGHAQFCVVSPDTGEQRQISSQPFSATSSFTWHPDGQSVVYVADGSVFRVFLAGREPQRLTPHKPTQDGPTHHACVFSPSGNQLAFTQPVTNASGRQSQIFCLQW